MKNVFRWLGGKVSNKDGKMDGWLSKGFSYLSSHLSICLLLYSHLTICLYAKSSGTTAAEFLKLSCGVRASGLGETFAGLANDSTAIFWNPAGLSLITWKELTASYNAWIENIAISNLSYAMPLAKAGSLGIGVTSLNSGSITQRGETKDDIGAYDMKDTGISAGYGTEVSLDLALGFSLKYISEKIDTESDSGFAADAGLLYFTQLNQHPLSLGISVLNLGSAMGPGEKSALPTKAKIGASSEFIDGKLVAVAEIDYPAASDMTAGAGFEYLISEIFAVRTGYKFFRDGLKGFEPVTFGFGIAYSQQQDYLLDYAFSNIGDLGFSNKVSLGIRF